MTLRSLADCRLQSCIKQLLHGMDESFQKFKQCDSDPIPTWLLKECSALLFPLSLTQLICHSALVTSTALKESVISFLHKKPTLDKDELFNYRPISSLSLISKIIERVVKSRLSDHLTSNNLVNPHQSAYCKHHSTETALQHDHLIDAIGSRKISCLCLLDLSAAFDTIDHNILLVYPLGLAFMALH